MTPEPRHPEEREQRWAEVLVACLEACESGQQPDREALLAAYPEFAAELAEFLEQRDHVQRLVTPLRALAGAMSEMTPSLGREDTFGGASGSSPDSAVRSFGEYEILERIARGGMGVVYKARQVRLNRVVALKMILRRGLDVRDERRFRNEAEFVARLDHPHIVPIYEVGEVAGQLYFTMKLLEGGSLAEAVRNGQWPVGGPQADRQAARLVAVIARTVHHAHQRGVLHRDLKPSNILLDADGQPHVSDFGLARRIDGDSDLTCSGTPVGTPRYMAPEQLARGRSDPTTATDVYGLGGILYVLLTGRPAFEGESMLDVFQQVRDGALTAPREHNPRVNRDLETICLKCLDKDPRRRYASAEALADDLHRFLQDEPIRARSAGTVERLHKWVRRQPALAALVVVCGLAVAGLVTGVLWYNGRLRTEAERAGAAEQRAEANYTDARDTVSRMLARLNDRRWAQVPQLYELQKEQTEDALAFYQAIARRSDEPDRAMQLDVAQAYYMAGLFAFGMNRLDESGNRLEQARLRLERLAGADPGNFDYQRRLAECWRALGHLQGHRRGPEDQPLHCYQEALSIWERLVQERPDDPDLRVQLAIDGNNLGHTHLADGRVSEARRCWEKALVIDRELVRDHPAVALYRKGLAIRLANLGDTYDTAGQAPQAEAVYHEAETLFEGLLREQPDELGLVSNLGITYVSRARVLMGTGRVQEAVALCTRGLALAEKGEHREPLHLIVNDTLMILWECRALAYSLTGEGSLASADWARAAAAAEKIKGLDARMVSAVALAHLGEYEKAAAQVGPAGPAGQFFRQALAYAACARAAGRDERLPAAERARRAESYAAEALRFLDKARAAGMLHLPAYRTLLRQGPSFESLRQRADFEKLLRELNEPRI